MQEVENQSRIGINVLDGALAFTRNVGKIYEDAPFFLKRHYLRFFFDKVMVQNKEIAEIAHPPIIALL